MAARAARWDRRVRVGCVPALLMVLGLAQPAAGASDVAWHRALRAGLDAVAVASDGSVYVAGSIRQRRAPWDSWAVLQRYSRSGVHVWTRRWSPADAWAESVDVETLADGSVVWAGAMNVDGMEGGLWFLRRYAADGELLWRRTAPSWRGGGASRIRDVAAGAGMIVAVGADFGCCGDPYRDGWVRAFGLDGSPRWEAAFEFPRIRPPLFDDAQAVTVGALGRVFVVGWAALERVAFDGEPVRRRLVVQKLGPDGDHVWTWRTAIPGGRRSVHVAGIAAHGPLVMLAARGGESVAPTSRSRGAAWAARLGFDGRLRWSRSWGAGAASGAQPADVAIGDDDTMYVVGSVRDPAEDRLVAFVRAYAGTGARLWATSFVPGPESLLATGVAARFERLIVTGTMLTGLRNEALGSGHLWSFDVET